MFHGASAFQRCSVCSCRFVCLSLSIPRIQHTLVRLCEGVTSDACTIQPHLSSFDSGSPDFPCPAPEHRISGTCCNTDSWETPLCPAVRTMRDALAGPGLADWLLNAFAFPHGPPSRSQCSATRPLTQLLQAVSSFHYTEKSHQT